MKISPINNNISFGYDKELNEELKNKLKQYPDKKWASTLSSMNSMCNKLENIIRIGEKKNNNPKLPDYLDLFLSYKQALTAFISVTFDAFNYADREYLHYFGDYIKSGANDDSWQKKTLQSLSEWISFNPAKLVKQKEQEAKLVNPEEEIKKTEEEMKKSITEGLNAIVNKISDKKFLSEYIPGAKSPKGFSDVAGMKELKTDLLEDVVAYLKNPEQEQLDLTEYDRELPKGILLYGPPGCGKTYITEALSAEAGIPLYKLNISQAGSSFINMTSKNIQAAFNEAVQIANETKKPCLLFMDEIDTLGFDRTARVEEENLKQVGTLLQAIDSVKDKKVIILGATNKFNLLDPAVLRRFDKQVFVDVPDKDARRELLCRNLSKASKAKKLLESKEDIEQVVSMLDGYSNDSICIITRKALALARSRNRDDISVADYKNAIEKSNRQKPDRKDYEALNKPSAKIGF